MNFCSRKGSRGQKIVSYNVPKFLRPARRFLVELNDDQPKESGEFDDYKYARFFDKF